MPRLPGAVSTTLARSLVLALRSGVRSPGGGAPGTGCELARETRPRYSMILRVGRQRSWEASEEGREGVPAHGFGVELAAGAPLAVVVLVAVGLVDDLFGDDFLWDEI